MYSIRPIRIATAIFSSNTDRVKSLISKIAYSKSSTINFVYLYLFLGYSHNDSMFSMFYFITGSTCHRFPLYNALSNSCIKSPTVGVDFYTRRYGQSCGGSRGSRLCGRGGEANSGCRSRIGGARSSGRRIARCKRSCCGGSSRRGNGRNSGGRSRSCSCGGRCSRRSCCSGCSWGSGVDSGESGLG